MWLHVCPGCRTVVVRVVYGANFKDHTDVIFQDLKFVKFCDLVKLKTCKVMYRAFNKTLPVNLNNIFTVCEPNCLFNMRKKKDFFYRNILGPKSNVCLNGWCKAVE